MSRLLVISEIIAPYRIPVFNRLAQQKGIDLHVIFLAESDPTLRQWRVYKEEIRFSYEVLPSWRWRVGNHNLLLNHGLREALERSAPRCIVFGGYNYPASWQTLRWSQSKRIPFLLWVESTARDQRGRSRVIEVMKTKFMNRCSGFVVPGKSSAEYLKSYGVPEAAIFTAPNAVDVELFARRAAAVRLDAAAHRQVLQLPSRFFLFVGRLVPEKGVFDLLEAYGRLEPGLRAEAGLVFVGDGVAHEELARRASCIAPAQVRFAGFVHREKLASYYALAEALVFPTWTDTWGLVVNEAMACSLAVISTHVAGCSADLVEDSWNGRVVRPGDSRQLASAMEQLATNPELCTEMGRRSSERILGYSPERCAAGIATAAFCCEGCAA